VGSLISARPLEILCGPEKEKTFDSGIIILSLDKKAKGYDGVYGNKIVLKGIRFIGFPAPSIYRYPDPESPDPKPPGNMIMSESEKLSASLEDYLETIFHVVAEKQAARAKDIAKRLNVNNSSVTGALRSLSEKGYINYAPYDLITLTAKGTELARDVVRRHEALQDFFTKILQIPPDEAEDAACKMEHAISPNILNRLIQFVEFVDICPRGGEDWIRGFGRHCERSEVGGCESCLSNCVSELQEKKELIQDPAKALVPLSRMKPGDKAVLSILAGRASALRHLNEIEAGPGNVVEIEAADQESENLTIKIKGYHLILRIEDAEKIMVLPC
jgi:DtxR family Mn-dependent transcriptional regulator